MHHFRKALNAQILVSVAVLVVGFWGLEYWVNSEKKESTVYKSYFIWCLILWFLCVIGSLCLAVYNRHKEQNDISLHVNIMRDGRKIKLEQTDIKVGDMIEVHTGMTIPVDGILFDGTKLEVDEYATTGKYIVDKKMVTKMNFTACEELYNEHNLLPINHNKIESPILLGGSKVHSGQGWLLCLVVGDNIKINKKASEE